MSDFVKILIMNTYNTYNYGSMMMAENFISYLINHGLRADFYIENTTRDNLIRLKEATSYNNIFGDEMLSVDNLNSPNKLVKIKNKIVEQLKIGKVSFYDAAVILGGDTFSEVYSKNVGVYLQLRKIAKINKKCKLYMVGQTIGPYTGWRAKLATKVFSKVKLFSRDDTSRNYLKNSLNIDAYSMRDLAFLDLNLQNDYDKNYQNILDKYNLTNGEYICVVGTGLANLYCEDSILFVNKFVEIINSIKERYSNKKLVWLSHVVTPKPDHSDNTMLELINNTKESFIDNNMVVINDPILPAEARIILGHGYFTLTCRMHAAVSTFQMGKPAICLSYSPKYRGVIAEGLDMADLVIESKGNEIWNGDIVKQVQNKMNYIDSNYANLQKKIKNNVESCKKIVSSNLDIIIKDMVSEKNE